MKEKNLTISLNLPPIDPLPEGVQKYFNACQEKLGLVPNVLKAHSFNIDKLNAFSGLYNELMLADSNLSKLEREIRNTSLLKYVRNQKLISSQFK